MKARLGLPSSFTYINGKVESYTYNADGSMKTKINRNELTTAYVYDIHGRLMSRNTGSQTISYTYDNNSNQLTMTDSTGTTTRTYDELNRTTTKNVPSIGMNTYVYDITTNVVAGNIKETSTDAKGNNVEKVYDMIGRLASVISADGTTTYTYDGNGNRISMEYPNGVKEEYTYYEDNLLKTLVNKKADGSIIDSYTYTYDAAHNQTSKTDAKGTTSYTYDSLNRLEKVVEPDGKTTTYTFDKAGNRLTEAVAVAETVTAMTNYTYDEQNRLTTTVTVKGNGVSEKLTYNYDDNGNMISKFKVKLNLAEPNLVGTFNIFKAGESEDSSVSFYEYDELNQLVKTTEGNKKISYAYNGEGYRVQKSINGQVSNYLYEGDKVVLETNGTGAQTAANIYGTNLVSRTADSETAYYLYNGHADVVALLSTTGSTLASYYYDAFGNATEKTGTASNPYRYAGYRYDEETDVYYLNARYYDAKIARFMTEDTYTGQMNDPLSLNLYTYCHNEPMMYVDPTGHYDAYIETNGSGGNGLNTKGIGSGNLTEGSKGDNVKLLQQKLKNAGYNITVDGVFGPMTESIVKQFQKDNGLSADGIVGYNTNKALFGKEDNKKNQKNDDDKKKSNEFNQNQGTGQSTSSGSGVYITKPSKPDEIQIHAITDVKRFLDRELNDSMYIYYLSTTSSPYAVSKSKSYTDRYNEAVKDDANENVLLFLLDAYMTIKSNDGEIHMPTRAIKTYSDNNSSPSLSESYDTFGEKLKDAELEMNIVNNSQYKYLINGPTERKEFINRLENLKGMISNDNLDIYDNEVNNIRYKEYMLENIDAIIYMNIDYKKSSEELIKYIEFMKKQK